jgi:hypothetical protein
MKVTFITSLTILLILSASVAFGIYRTFKSLAFGVSGICALIGSMKVYSKLSQGDGDFRRSILVWFGACLTALLIPSILDALFL